MTPFSSCFDRPNRAVLIGAALAASAAAVSIAPALPTPSAAAAKSDKGTIVTNVFDAKFELTTIWQHHQAIPGMTAEDSLRYTTSGTIPNVEFVDSRLQLHRSAKVAATVEGAVKMNTNKPEGTSSTCTGTTVEVSGFAGVGRAKGGFWFAPWIAGTGRGDCTDTDGGSGPFELPITPPFAAKADATITPPGAYEFPVRFADIDGDRWAQKFRLEYEGKDCPRFDQPTTTSCTIVTTGTVTLERKSRKEEEDDTDLLAPTEGPKLNKRKTKATTTVECRRSCDIEALIGVFGGTKKNPRVIPIRRKKVRLKANRETTFSMPVNAKGRAAAKQGRLVMQLQVKGGGKRDTQIHPLI